MNCVNDDDETLSTFIDGMTKTWRCELIDATFSSLEASFIRTLSISKCVASTAAIEKSIWRKVWSCSLPKKVKAFLWKILHGILPTAKNLEDRGVPMDSLCAQCNTEVETGLHAIRVCPVSMQQFGFASWTLWNERNKEIHADVRTLAHVAGKVHCFIEEYKVAMLRNETCISEESAYWEKPKEPFMKVNFNGAFDKASSSGGVGIVIQNAEGLVMGVKMTKVTSVSDSFAVEAQAAVQFVLDLGFRDIMLEGDNLCVIKGLNRLDEDLSPVGCLLEKGRLYLDFF
ncbi:hypothetical protein PTKIN_Ptkin01aG0260900 [Pterospermum kingtungense]